MPSAVASTPPTNGTLASKDERTTLFSATPTQTFTLRMQSEDLKPTQIYFDADIYPKDDRDLFSLPQVDFGSTFSKFAEDTQSDYRNFYSRKNLPVAASFLGVGAWLANSDLDQNILEHIQDNITFNSSTNEYQEFVGEFRFFGEGYFLLPIYASTALLGKHVFSGNANAEVAGEWGERCVRGIFVGAPPLMISQYLIGGSRPGESGEKREGSEWQFLKDNNGVSGHAFMGAIPFLTAFHMAKDPRAKVFYFAASTLPALSRITENGHYPSQALLGWGLAYMATSSINQTENGTFQVAPYLSENGVGLGATFRR